jgi:hypothetical protein
VRVRGQLRFYFELLSIAVGGGVVGFAIAEGHWYSAAALFIVLPVGIYRMWDQYRPDAAERRASEVRRREAERDYEH